MNPLLPALYLWRRKGYALSLLAIVSFSLFGSGSIVGMKTIIADSSISEFVYQKTVLAFTPDRSELTAADFQAYVENDPRVERILPAASRTLRAYVFASPLTNLLSVRAEDAEYLMDKLQLKLVAGRLFTPGTNEVVLSERQVKARGLKLGDVFGNEDTEWSRSPIRLVGILGGPASIGLGSLEYSAGVLKARPTALVIGKTEGDLQSLTMDLAKTPFGKDIQNFDRTYASVQKYLRDLDTILLFIVSINTAVLALIISLLGYIALRQRLPEICIFSAMGYGRGYLLRRLAVENCLILSVGWFLSLAMTGILFRSLSQAFFEPRGMVAPVISWPTIDFTFPMVLVLVLVNLGVAGFYLYKLDTIATIEVH